LCEFCQSRSTDNSVHNGSSGSGNAITDGRAIDFADQPENIAACNPTGRPSGDTPNQ
jgi:hypothetical protein